MLLMGFIVYPKKVPAKNLLGIREYDSIKKSYLRDRHFQFD